MLVVTFNMTNTTLIDLGQRINSGSVLKGSGKGRGQAALPLSIKGGVGGSWALLPCGVGVVVQWGMQGAFVKIERSQTESHLCKWQKHKRKIAPFGSEMGIFEPHMRHTENVVCENGDYTYSQIVHLWT